MNSRRVGKTRDDSPDSPALVRFHTESLPMIVLGVILLVLGAILGIPLLTTLGGILAIVGVALAVLGAMGRGLGRAHYY